MSVHLHWNSTWAYKHVHLKRLEILGKTIYYLKCDKLDLHRAASQAQECCQTQNYNFTNLTGICEGALLCP